MVTGKVLRTLAVVAAMVVTMGCTPATERGSYAVPGLGARKQAVLAVGANSLDLAVAMLETETMTPSYPYGDGKTGDAANFGIFKQNWRMIREADPRFGRTTAEDFDRGALLNTDLRRDVEVLHAAQRRWSIQRWFAGQRNGETGLGKTSSDDIAAYTRAVYWIRDQIDSDPANLANATRFWVEVPPI